MRNFRRSIALLALLIIVGLFMIACGPEPPSNHNANANQARTTAIATKEDEDACNADISLRPGAVETRLNYWIEDDDELKGRIQLQVVPVNNRYLEVFMSGEARGQDDFEDLYQIVRKFMHKDDKKGCVRKVKFAAPGPGEMRTRAVAFEWSACKYPPDVVCPTGECHSEPCPLIIGNTNSNGNSNANSNVNGNTNTNSNTNVSSNSSSGSNTGNG